MYKISQNLQKHAFFNEHIHSHFTQLLLITLWNIIRQALAYEK